MNRAVDIKQFPPIADGWVSNEEDKDLQTPIPFKEIGVNSVSDLKVVLVHRWFSPSSCGVRAVLNYYQVPQERLMMDLPLKSAVSKSSYKKVPQVVVRPANNPHSGGYQVNDSWVVVKNLYPVLTGRTLEADMGDDEKIKELLNLVPVSLVASLHNETKEGPGQFARHFCWPETKSIIWNPILRFIVKGIVAGKMKEFNRKTPANFRQQMKKFVAERQSRNPNGQFWCSGNEPGPVDLILYGYIVNGIALVGDRPNNKNGSQSCWVIEDVKAAGASEWYSAVDAAYKGRDGEPVIPEGMAEMVTASDACCW